MSLISIRILPVKSFTSAPSKVKIVLPEGQKEFATMVSVDCDESSSQGDIKHDWKETEIRYSVDEPQLLFVSLASIDSMPDGTPRFHIHDIDTTADVTSLHYVDGKTWKKYGAHQKNFPHGTLMIRIQLNLLRNGSTDKINLSVMDNEKGSAFSVDPLVGNDPPGDTGGTS